MRRYIASMYIGVYFSLYSWRFTYLIKTSVFDIPVLNRLRSSLWCKRDRLLDHFFLVAFGRNGSMVTNGNRFLSVILTNGTFFNPSIVFYTVDHNIGMNCHNVWFIYNGWKDGRRYIKWWKVNLGALTLHPYYKISIYRTDWQKASVEHRGSTCGASLCWSPDFFLRSNHECLPTTAACHDILCTHPVRLYQTGCRTESKWHCLTR